MSPGRIAAVLGLAAALTATACGGGPPAPAAYLSRWGMTVQLIQWQPTTGNQVRGSVVGVSAGGTPPAERLYPFTTGVTGTVNGSRVSLKFGYYTQALTGTLDGGRLILQGYDAPSGAIGTVTWTASSAGAYNTALAALRSRVRHANLVAERRQADAQAEQSARSDVAALQQAASLGGGTLAGDLAAFTSDAQSAGADLRMTRQDAGASKGFCNASLMVNGDTLDLAVPARPCALTGMPGLAWG